ncbi:uncharacterized protein LOC116347917 [Contarinia nasturtii]|uniref:uncharacterized protein LOC116347917 n=1 Tax=Contarinia nasturtii TaxID=265458 RepID=UPI0012D41CFE|nr:uncharacterized protein LOC116347917 [Contarinia nasturtii]XP_031634583.1 uncharacterized protein LOC116347917 [Contarinia nasturtii]
MAITNSWIVNFQLHLMKQIVVGENPFKKRKQQKGIPMTSQFIFFSQNKRLIRDQGIPLPRRRLQSCTISNRWPKSYQCEQTIVRMWREMRDMGDVIAATLRDGPNAGRLVSKKQRFFKTWLPNVANFEIEGAAGARPTLTTVWHRDITAAELILYKGECVVFKRTIHPNVRRPRRNDNNQPLPLYRGQNQNVNNENLQP